MSVSNFPQCNARSNGRITLALHRSNSGVGVGGLPEAGILPADTAPSVTR